MINSIMRKTLIAIRDNSKEPETVRLCSKTLDLVDGIDKEYLQALKEHMSEKRHMLMESQND